MPNPKPRSVISILILLAVYPHLVGCNSLLVGHWKAEPAPEDADFYISRAEFKEDGTFRGVGRAKGVDPKIVRGQYEFNGFRLTLTQPGKEKRVYPATYWMLTRTLQLTVNGQKYSMKKE